MDNNIDNLKKLLEKIKTIRFWERLFSWKRVQQLLVDATPDLQKLVSNVEHLIEDNADLHSTKSELDKANEKVIRYESEILATNTTISNLSKDNSELTKELATIKESATNLGERKNELDVELAGMKVTIAKSQEELKDVQQKYTELLAGEEMRNETYKKDVAVLNSIKENIQNERNAEKEELNNAELKRIQALKETWFKHQENVQEIVKRICNKHTIEYVDKVPFKGDPDNTLLICDEYVIFDAKSPANEDLSNFPTYLKIQAEAAKKYAKQENVKPDIFFVVPTNTLEKLTTFVFNLADYNVFIISVDSLEQIILSLKKIEDYEFAEQLSPEERENICRVLGKFAHLTKRRIQIDSYFINQFIELIHKSETALPKDILEKVYEFEKSEKLNPPQEKRAKKIEIKELEKDNSKLTNETVIKGIVVDDNKISTGLNDIQLYDNEKDKNE